jgi:hypothetical protein
MAPKRMKDLVDAHAEESSQIAQQRKEMKMAVMVNGNAPTGTYAYIIAICVACLSMQLNYICIGYCVMYVYQ